MGRSTQTGLCFSCRHKYSPQHKCTDSQFHVLLLAEGEDTDDNGEFRPMESIDDEHPLIDGECHALGSRGFTADSSSTIRTIKLAGQLCGITTIILIDGGATHNFISKTLASGTRGHLLSTFIHQFG